MYLQNGVSGLFYIALVFCKCLENHVHIAIFSSSKGLNVFLENRCFSSLNKCNSEFDNTLNVTGDGILLHYCFYTYAV